MLFTLASRYQRSQDQFDLIALDAVTWPDACLGIPQRAACAEAETPGYRLVVGLDGERYEYHASAADPFRLVLAAGPPHGIDAPALAWEGEAGGCQQLLLDAGARAAIGPCDAPLLPLRLPAASHTQSEWDSLRHRFAPFDAETAAGTVRFRGEGEERATPAWQLALAEWAQLAWAELQMGRRGASWGAALAWRAPLPDKPGYCLHLSVEIYGWAAASEAQCEGGEARTSGEGWVPAAVWEPFSTWLHRYGVVEHEGLYFFGKGTEAMPDAERARLQAWAEQRYAHLTRQP